MQVRRATPNDALATLALHVASVRAFGPAGYAPDQVRAWARKDHGPEGYPIADDAHHLVVAERGGEVAGFGDLVPGSDDVDADGEVRAVYVHPAHDGRGVGSALLAELEGYARGSGLGSLELPRRRTPSGSTSGRATNGSARRDTTPAASTSTSSSGKPSDTDGRSPSGEYRSRPSARP